MPNESSCVSYQYLFFIDYFGNSGGYEMILDVLENGEIDDKLDI